MGIGERIRAERARLGRTQAEFAALAGASKGAQLKWEKEESSPTGAILSAWADAGADVLYILTGRRSGDRTLGVLADVEGRLASIRNGVLQPGLGRRPGESGEAADKHHHSMYADELSGFLNNHSDLPPEMREEIEQLIAVTTKPAALALYRAADYAQRRAKRGEIREQLAAYLGTAPYVPSDSVSHLIAALVLDFDVPVNVLAELVDVLYSDIVERAAREKKKFEPQR